MSVSDIAMPPLTNPRVLTVLSLERLFGFTETVSSRKNNVYIIHFYRIKQMSYLLETTRLDIFNRLKAFKNSLTHLPPGHYKQKYNLLLKCLYIYLF